MKWLAKVPVESPCASLWDFNKLIGSMTLVPYNGLSLHVDETKSNYSCPCNSPEELFRNVWDKLTWRHLDTLINLKCKFDERNPRPCAAARLGLTLLEQKLVELESLKFTLDDNLQCLFNSSWPPALPKLKAICFPKHFGGVFCLKSSKTSFLTRLTKAAPNLKEISGLMDPARLQLLPKEKWECVKEFYYSQGLSGKELEIASQFVSKGPSLRKFSLEFVPSAVDCTIFNVLFELGQQTMEDLAVRSFANVIEPIRSRLQLPKLSKLRVLRLHLTSRVREAMAKARWLLNRHDGKVFSQLEEFHLSVEHDDVHNGYFLPMPEAWDEIQCNEIPRLPHLVQSVFSVSKLRLDPASLDFVQIKSLFPAVTDLRIICKHDYEQTGLPYQQIFRLWQNLETVTICCDFFESAYNLDAALCGLDEKEVDELGQEDDNFLMAVELVPIAPCVLTMRNLLSFTIEYPKRSIGVCELGTYMTRVTGMLASRYLPKAVMNVPGDPSALLCQDC